ncbi:ubiquitin-conjugating enzyme E2 [Pelolinea submarina]|uniref:Ubiquitin-conjugating enzyme n=1 Tax=Pelolinea submarina TaxID=913107 RepID=A0A3E0AIB5_9CHLR|nr:ubiquitin-conjugating enzyme E2 [Pelolinea submarina]REG11422.1 ubiquitin-conjugating enzyme [Pelolinea submarina]
MNPKLRRLQSDQKQIQDLADRSKYITILEQNGGTPPNQYLISLHFKAITSINSANQPVYGYDHKLRIDLHQDYPDKKPIFTFATPMFHPNINEGGEVCIGNEYTPAQCIDELILRVIHMIRWENVGLNDPWCFAAVRWARESWDNQPLDKSQIYTEEEVDIHVYNSPPAHPNQHPTDPPTLFPPPAGVKDPDEIEIILLEDDNNNKEEIEITVLGDANVVPTQGDSNNHNDSQDIEITVL